MNTQLLHGTANHMQPCFFMWRILDDVETTLEQRHLKPFVLFVFGLPNQMQPKERSSGRGGIQKMTQVHLASIVDLRWIGHFIFVTAIGTDHVFSFYSSTQAIAGIFIGSWESYLGLFFVVSSFGWTERNQFQDTPYHTQRTKYKLVGSEISLGLTKTSHRYMYIYIYIYTYKYIYIYTGGSFIITRIGV